MQFKVTGSSRDTGARMTMEIEADSKGSAQKKAEAQGMIVNHCVAVGDAPIGVGPRSGKGDSYAHKSPIGGLVKLVAIAAILAIAAFVAWTYVKPMLGR